MLPWDLARAISIRSKIAGESRRKSYFGIGRSVGVAKSGGISRKVEEETRQSRERSDDAFDCELAPETRCSRKFERELGVYRVSQSEPVNS